MSAGYGLSVRWSLEQAPEGVEAELREYVVHTSIDRFSLKEGLAFKTWRMRPREWFEGTYVWASAAARDAFVQSFSAEAATSAGSEIIGAPPVSIEPFEVVAIAEGPSGFTRGPGPGD